MYGEVVDVATVRDWEAEYPATAAATAVGGAVGVPAIPPEGRPKGRLAEVELLKVFPAEAAPGDALLEEDGLANCCCRAERGLAAAWPIRPCHFSRRSRRLLRLGLALALPLPDEPALVPVPAENPAPPALNRGGVVRGAPPRGDGTGPPDRKLGDSIVDDLIFFNLNGPLVCRSRQVRLSVEVGPPNRCKLKSFSLSDTSASESNTIVQPATSSICLVTSSSERSKQFKSPSRSGIRKSSTSRDGLCAVLDDFNHRREFRATTPKDTIYCRVLAIANGGGGI